MTLQLEPPDYRSYLPVDELVRRLRAEFSFVVVDTQAGRDHVAPLLRQFETAPPAALARIRRLHDEAVQVTVADTPNHGLASVSFVAMPGRGLWVGLESAAHEEETTGLLERCCRALGYVVGPDGAG